MRKDNEKQHDYRDRIAKCSMFSNRNTANSSSIFTQIRLQMSKFFEQQDKNISDQRPKYNNLRQVVYQKARINPEYDLGQNKKIQPFINNFIQHPNKQSPSEKLIQSHKNSSNDRVSQNTSNRSTSARKKKQIEKKNFNYKFIIGKGGFGKVWKVEHIKTKEKYAMKEMLKSIVLTKKSVQSILNQQKILGKLKSSFIVNMQFAFQDRETLFLVLDLMEGGDLRHHINLKTFNESQAKFMIACLILGLEYIHKHHIIHRDIKPENLVFDSRGYLRITDFGIARVHRQQNSSDTSGTPGYMSPEVICRQNHSYISDFFAVGVISYELMLGKRPYHGFSRSEIRQNMLAKQAAVKPYQVPQNWSMHAMDFTNRLLQRKPEQRLGVNGIEEIKNHPWLSSLNWYKLSRKEIESPFIPSMQKSDFDQDEQITIQDEEEGQLIEKNALLLRRQQFQDLFKDYYYAPDEQRVQINHKHRLENRRKTETRCDKIYLGSRTRMHEKSGFHNYTQNNSRNSLNSSKNQMPFNLQEFLLSKK